MKRHVLSVLLLTAAFMPAMAEERSDAEMMAIARQRWGTQVKAFGQQAVPALTRVYDDAAVAVYSPENGESFVIVSRDDRMRPVLGIAAGHFDIQKMPCGMKAWLAGISQQLTALNEQPTARRAPGGYDDEEEIDDVEPMLSTFWGQEEPFNELVPMDGNAPVTGCVALALAQMMNYHQWPASAAFEGHYITQRFRDENGTTVGYWSPEKQDVNSVYEYPYEDAYYYFVPEGEMFSQWALQDEDANRKVATLLRDCGFAVNMRYQSNLASAYLPSAATAFFQTFHYAPSSVRYLSAPYFTAAEWTAMLNRELYSGCPVIYGAEDPNPEKPRQHAFIIDGVSYGLYHVNWGWYGYMNGYYALNALDAGEAGNYSDNHSMVIGIRKEALPYDGIHPLLTADSYTFTYTPNQANKSLKATLQRCYNISIQPMVGRLYIVVEDEAGGQPFYGDIFNQDISLPPITDGSITGWNEIPGAFPATSPTFTNGHTYRIYVAYKDNTENSYQPIRTAREGGPIYYTLTIDAQGQGAISGPQLLEEYLVTTGVKDIKGQTIADDGITRVYDLQGRLVHTAPTASFNLWEVPARGVLVIKQGNDVRKVAR
ncbi:MAG: C10 family peptidase [Bacteroidaceae bacterium]|nr:C10 family peptidase [Bacteroidaceae bacterium]